MTKMVDCTGDSGGCYYVTDDTAAEGDKDGIGAEAAADVAVVVAELARKRVMRWVMTFGSAQEVVRRCRSGTVLVFVRRRRRPNIRESGER
jgi:hypothetical protein